MTQEEKQLLLKDLCARLLYGVKLRYVEDLVVKKESHIITLNNIYLEHIINGDADIKPYLRSMSSMTEEELNELIEFEDIDYNNNNNVVKRAMMAFSEDKRIESNSLFCIQYARSIDWLNAHHFDYRGLIEKGLALEAPDGMYNNVITK